MATPKKTSANSKTAAKKASQKSTVKKSAAKKPAVRTRATAAKSSKSTQAKARRAKNTPKKSVAAKTAKSTVADKGSNPLKWYFIAGAALLAFLAAAVALFGNDMQVGVTSQYLAENQLTESGELLPALTELFSFNVLYLIVAILLAASTWRVLLLTKLSKRYNEDIKGRFTSLHWVELSFLAPLFFSVVGLIVGVRDIMTLLLLIAVPVGVSVLGYISDRYNMLQNSTWLKTKIAIDALIIPWVVVGTYLLHTYIYGFVTLSIWLYALLLAAFIAYVLLAVVHKKQILAESRFSDFVFAEKWIASIHLFMLILLGAVVFIQ